MFQCCDSFRRDFANPNIYLSLSERSCFLDFSYSKHAVRVLHLSNWLSFTLIFVMLIEACRVCIGSTALVGFLVAT